MTPTLTIAQVASALQVSPDTVRAWWAKGQWPDGKPMLGMKLGSETGSRVRIFQSDADAFQVRAATIDARPTVRRELGGPRRASRSDRQVEAEMRRLENWLQLERAGQRRGRKSESSPPTNAQAISTT